MATAVACMASPAWSFGDICDNAIKSKLNLLALAAEAEQQPVIQYYDKEYIKAHEQLRELCHPIVLVPGNVADALLAYFADPSA